MDQYTGKSFEELLNAYVNGQLDPDDVSMLRKLLQNDKYQQALKTIIGDKLADESLNGLADPKRGDIIFSNIMSASASQAEHSYTQPVRLPAKPFFNKARMLMAASILLVFLAAGIYLFNNKPQQPAITITAHKKGEYKNDVSPGGEKATLTLADGTVINLDAAKNGALAKQGSSNIIKIDGKINYEQLNAGAQDILYNTITTPKGGQYQVLLPDGSLVWLNAASSIYFPTAFAVNERRVKINGEAYFEVTKDKSKPFIVESGSSEVKVLGTHFNVMAYNDEEDMKTTLLEGAVAFSNNSRTLMLQPGEQSRLMKDGRLTKSADADADDILAWKNGMFHFENADIHSIMRQLSRWYDVEVEYRGAPAKDGYFLEMSRTSKLSSVLKVLELTSNIHLEIEGHKIIIS